ncbi:MAG TPA: SGNH/GDSL hydrolase family protein [Acidobacteriaceae bacterium]|nr:SGNH/GDSL hydrolase family protein [Acidobacteriaceae bacterium]
MRFKIGLAVAAVSAFLSHAALAASFSEIVAFGDSLSDAGNASIATLGAQPGPGYATRNVPLVPFPVGYFTNPQSGSGPAGLWVDQFAADIGVADPSPALAPLGGTNYAVGSATTATGLASMQNQVGLFLTNTAGVAPSAALYTFWGGANDILGNLSPTAAADNIAAQIAAVAGAGGHNFLWLNLPELGDIPELIGNPVLAAAVNAQSDAFNTEWAKDLAFLQSQGIDVTGVNINSLFGDILANPAAYGLTNTASACDLTPGCDPNTFLYWDTEHPTTYADSLVATFADQALNPTPEPPSAVLAGIGCAGLLVLVMRKRSWPLARG